ncbi:Tigger transposable element-derived protein 1 [Eumeta japonica]|uniref:Tigger transposable element-derived protein 1 n=1 Tax=Eumeta variegata TaxID=151549 RepID=A0A4C1VU44_EUMVA|nr:Tigger transposable element-derived protein 1 [Eumeta japonica]
MEVALSLWIEDRNQKRMPLCGPMVREKAKRLYAHFKEPDGSFSGECTDGGFQASEDTAAVGRYPEEFSNLVADGEYKPEQVFNADETALFWKRMPNKTFISKSEKSAPGFKAAKDRVTLLLCSNASGDCVIKPLMLYRSFNPRVFNHSKIKTRTTCQCFGVLIRKRGLQALFFVTGSGIVLFLKLKLI